MPEALRPVYFNHIPKAMGTTLHGLLEPAYPLASIFTTAHHGGHYHPIFQLSEKDRSHLRLITGHVPEHAFRQAVPELREVVKITGVRHPFSRLASRFLHGKRAGVENKIRTLDAIEHGDYAKAIGLMEAWYPPESMPAWLLPEPYAERGDLVKAFHVLDGYHLVYDGKSFDACYKELSRQLGYGEIADVPVKNAAPKKQDASDLPQAFEEVFREAFPEDYAFYDKALQLAEQTQKNFPSLLRDGKALDYPPVASLSSAFPVMGWSARYLTAIRCERLAEASHTQMMLPAISGKAELMVMLGVAQPLRPEDVAVFINGVPLEAWVNAHAGTVKRSSHGVVFQASVVNSPVIKLETRQPSFYHAALTLKQLRWRAAH